MVGEGLFSFTPQLSEFLAYSYKFPPLNHHLLHRHQFNPNHLSPVHS